jgi:hypothetical protein
LAPFVPLIPLTPSSPSSAQAANISAAKGAIHVVLFISKLLWLSLAEEPILEEPP